MSSLGYPVKVGNRYCSWYSYGCMMFECKQPLPTSKDRLEVLHPHYVQGWIAAAKKHDAFMLSCMKEQERRGLFEFLPMYTHLRSSKRRLV